jgi:hypothetical protein
MIEFIGPLYNWLQQFKNRWHTVSFFRLNTLSPTELLDYSKSQSQSHVTTDDQSASLSWNKAPICGLRPDFHYWQTIADYSMLQTLVT